MDKYYYEQEINSKLRELSILKDRKDKLHSYSSYDEYLANQRRINELQDEIKLFNQELIKIIEKEYKLDEARKKLQFEMKSTRQEKMDAIEEAKDRYNSKSSFSKLIDKITSKYPSWNKIEREMDVEQIKVLYKKK